MLKRTLFALISILLMLPAAVMASEAELKLPNLDDSSLGTFLGGMTGHDLLMWGILICVLGLLFGLMIYRNVKNMPVHKSMLEMSELIYETCKTYLLTQGKFLLILELFIGAIMVLYFGFLAHYTDPATGI